MMRIRMLNLYDNRRIGKLVFMVVAAVAIVVFLLISNSLVKDLAQQEKERMHIWAQATERLTKASPNEDFDFLLTIISQNNSIPVMVADEKGNISQFRNFSLPEPIPADTYAFTDLSGRNRRYLEERLADAANGRTLADAARTDRHFIVVEIDPVTRHYIYYEDSILLKRLSYYPYIQLIVMIIIAVILYLAVVYTKRAEQNRVWVGLSKETAHQLGTPISSLMAWTEYLQAAEGDAEAAAQAAEEMDKDVKRLSTIAARFSKIGSVPELTLEYLNDAISRSLEYMRHRVSGKVDIRMEFSSDDHAVMLSAPLFEWVMENLTKNAVDAMEGAGRLTITTGTDRDRLFIDITDTGKGIPRKNFKTVFSPGYTTKKRGWGLGLTLAKRIIEEYHRGRIYVKRSEPGKGTTFRIELPAAK